MDAVCVSVCVCVLWLLWTANAHPLVWLEGSFTRQSAGLTMGK